MLHNASACELPARLMACYQWTPEIFLVAAEHDCHNHTLKLGEACYRIMKGCLHSGRQHDELGNCMVFKSLW